MWQDPRVFEHPVCGLARGADRVAGDPAAHAHFSCQGRDAFDAGVAGGRAVVAHIAGLYRDANAKRLSQAGVGLNQVGGHAFGHHHVGAGLDEQRAATSVQVEVNIRPAEDMVGHIAGDLLGWQTVVVAGEDPVEVEVVDRRGAAPGSQGWRVERGEQNQLSGHIARLDLPHQFRDHHRPLVLIAMNSARHHHHRPLAVFDGGCGEGDHAPGVVIGRVGQVQRAHLLAVLVPVDVAEYGCAHSDVFLV